MVLSDTIQINAPAESIFRFFDRMDALYRDWHPDHVLFRWERGHDLHCGNVFYFEERIAGKLLKKRVVITAVQRPIHLEFAPTFWLMRAFLPRILFHIAPTQGGCLVTAEIHLRMGPLAAWLNRNELAAIREHMKQEGLNMKRLVEAA
jgi:Polyketide cyclase / dehydrase and lipid transport